MGILQQKSVCFEALFLAVKRDNIVFVAVSLVIVFSWRTVNDYLLRLHLRIFDQLSKKYVA